MGQGVSRREFVKAGTAVSVTAVLPKTATAESATLLVPKATPPVVIASASAGSSSRLATWPISPSASAPTAITR